MNLTICLDLGSLPSYCALAPIVKLLGETGVQAEWLPLARDTGEPKTTSTVDATLAADDPLAAYKARRQHARDRWAERELARMCDLLGLTTAQGGRRFDATVLNAGLLFVADVGGDCAAYLARAYETAFRSDANVTDPELVAKLVGDDHFVGFYKGSAGERLRSTREALNEQGIVLSPGFVCSGEVFQGRQHLPIIRWLLEGRVGPPPV